MPPTPGPVPEHLLAASVLVQIYNLVPSLRAALSKALMLGG